MPDRHDSKSLTFISFKQQWSEDNKTIHKAPNPKYIK